MLRCFALTVTLATAGIKPAGKSAKPEQDLSAILSPGGDPNDPHAKGFEPRPGPDEGGDIWTFGRAHAAAQHALDSEAGNALAVAEALDLFSAEHRLSFGLGPAHGAVLDGLVRSAAAAAVARDKPGAPAAGLHVLVLDSGLGAGTLRLLPPLLAASGRGHHELVGVETNDHLSDVGARLVAHALDGAEGAEVRHTALLPGDDTSFEEMIESLTDGYEIGKAGFDVVLLGGGGRAEHMRKMETLVERKALRLGSIVHTASHREDPETEWYLGTTQRGVGGGRFEHEIHDVEGNVTAVVSTFRGRDKDGEL